MFIKLTSNGMEIYINKDWVVEMKAEGTGALIGFYDGSKVFVDEAPEAILKLMKPVPKKKEV